MASTVALPDLLSGICTGVVLLSLPASPLAVASHLCLYRCRLLFVCSVCSEGTRLLKMLPFFLEITSLTAGSAASWRNGDIGVSLPLEGLCRELESIEFVSCNSTDAER
uniref:Uncharacterized protein n=1 Tax=Glossina brevipalpis TaxID=37001 RepID=A0A1A9WCK1_9MUSC